MRFKCSGGDTSADGICETITFALNVDDLQFDTQGFLSLALQIDTQSFLSLARSFVSPPAYLLAIENLVYQQLADMLSPPHLNTGCQANSMWLLS